ncbi:MAG: hypothetical protein R3F46_14105 [bacterium]
MLRRFPDPTISYLGNGLVNRRLLKSIAFELKAQKQIATFYNGASDILRKHGFDPDYFLREDKPGDVPFKVYDRLSNPNARTLYVKVDGRLQPLQSVSDPVDALRPYEETRLYVPLECREEIDTMHKRLYS